MDVVLIVWIIMLNKIKNFIQSFKKNPTIYLDPEDVFTDDEVDLIDEAFGEVTLINSIQELNEWVNKDTDCTNQLRRYLKSIKEDSIFIACLRFYSIKPIISYPSHPVLDKIKAMVE